MNNNKLTIVWLSVDKQAAIDMALLYARDSILNGWWREIELILWGPTVETAAENDAVKQEIEILSSLGADIKACYSCAARYGTVEKLRAMNVEVDGMGEHLTALLASKAPLLLI